MLEDIRNHDARPTREELRWLAFDGVEFLARAVVIAALALTLGWTASLLLEVGEPATAVAHSTR